MPLVQTRGAASAQGFGEFAQATVANYIEDVFSTYLYDGNSSTQTIINGVDLSNKGGLVWAKNRTGANFHLLVDTVRGFNSEIYSNSTSAASTGGSDYTSWNTNGYSLGFISGNENVSGRSFVSWTFAKQPKFFDVVTYTGNGANRTIAHNLGSVPGCIIIKDNSAVSNWYVYHRSLATNQALKLNSTAAIETAATLWNNTAATSSVFSLGTAGDVNGNGDSFVAYVFAHDAGGFGLTGTDNVISCGTFTSNASGAATVNLGYEPQWILYKSTAASTDWYIYDTMRGWGQTTAMQLLPNTSQAESQNASSPYFFYPTATGFESANSWFAASQAHIYIAIRRGPMKVPTLGTSVYNAIARTGTGAAANVTGVGFSPDLVITGHRTNPTFGFNKPAVDRLRGPKTKIYVDATALEGVTTDSFLSFNTDGFSLGADGAEGNWNENLATLINWNFRRAPGFFDEVCYTGDGITGRAILHNLDSSPELIFVKCRSNTGNWMVYNASMTYDQVAFLDLTNAFSSSPTIWHSEPNSNEFFVGSSTRMNVSARTYVAYLFATIAGVSKVGSYTGTGTTLQINCGFTAGARFVLIKRTDSTGDWYVWDSARGIVAGNDPYLLLNSTAAEVTGTDYVDTYSAGFEISSTAPAAINASAGSFIFLAIA